MANENTEVKTLSPQEQFISNYMSPILEATKGTPFLPSVMMAQAALESNWGKSELASKYNNLFGIQADPSWTGEKVMLLTDEYDKDTRQYVKVEKPFRVYNNVADSIRDRIAYLEDNPRYGDISKNKDYRSQSIFLQSAGYATDPMYAGKLISLIDDYDIYTLDTNKSWEFKPKPGRGRPASFPDIPIYKENMAMAIDFEEKTLQGQRPEAIYNETLRSSLPMKPPSSTPEGLMNKYNLTKEQAEEAYNLIQENYKAFKSGELYAGMSDRYFIPNNAFSRMWFPEQVDMVSPREHKIATADPTVFDMLPGFTDVKYIHEDQIASKMPYGKDKSGNWIPTEELKNNGGYLQWEYGDPMKGEPPIYWKELGDDEFAIGDRIRTVFGDRSLNSKVGGSMLRGFYAGTIPLMVKSVGSLVGTLGDYAAWLAHESGEDYVTKDFERELMKWGSYNTHKNYDEQQKAFSNWNSAMWNIEFGIGQVASMMATSGATSYLSMARGASIATSQKFGLQVGLLMGSGESGAGYKEVMREMGVSESESSMWYAPFFITTYLSEKILTPNVIQNFGGNLAIRKYLGVSQKELKEMIDKEAQKEVVLTGVKSVKELSKDSKRRIGEKVLHAIAWPGNKLKKVSEMGVWGKIPVGKVGVGTFEEFSEELSEGVMHSGISYGFNGVQRLHAQAIDENYGWMRNAEVKYNDDETVTVTGRKGESHTMSQEDYFDASRQLSYSDGVKSGRINLSTKVDMDEAYLAGISTFITLGLLSPMIHEQNSNRKKGALDAAIAENADPKLRQHYIATLDDMIAKKMITPEIKERFLQEVDYYHQVINMYGLDSDQVKMSTGSAPGILRNAIGYADKIEQLKKYEADLAAYTANPQAEGAVKPVLTEEIMNSIRVMNRKTADEPLTEEDTSPQELQKLMGYLTEKFNYFVKPKETTYQYKGKEYKGLRSQAFTDAFSRTVLMNRMMNEKIRAFAVDLSKKEGIKEEDEGFEENLKRHWAEAKKMFFTSLIEDEKYYKDLYITASVMIDQYKKTAEMVNDASKRSFLYDYDDTFNKLYESMISNYTSQTPLTDLEMNYFMMGFIKSATTLTEGFDAQDLIDLLKRDTIQNPESEMHKNEITKLEAAASSLLPRLRISPSRPQGIRKVLTDLRKDISDRIDNNFKNFNNKDFETKKLLKVLDDFLSNEFLENGDQDLIASINNKTPYTNKEIQLSVIHQMIASLKFDPQQNKTLLDELNSIQAMIAAGNEISNAIDKSAHMDAFKVMLEDLKELIKINYYHMQEGLGGTAEHFEHSALNDKPMSRMEKAAVDKSIEEIDNLIKEVSAVSDELLKYTEAFYSTMIREYIGHSDIKLAIFEHVEELLDMLPDEEAKTAVKTHLENIRKILEENTYKKDDKDVPIENLDTLYNLIFHTTEAKGDPSKLAEFARLNDLYLQIEKELIDLDDAMSGKLDKIIEHISNKADKFTELKDMILYDEKNQDTLKGPYSRMMYLQGKKTMEGKTSGGNINEHDDASSLYLWATLTHLNRINSAKKNGTPSYREQYIALRDTLAQRGQYIRDEGTGSFNLNFIGKRKMVYPDQEFAVLHMLNKFFSPSADWIKVTGFHLLAMSNALFLNGYGGVGKSTVIADLFFDTLTKLRSDEKALSVTIIVPSVYLQNQWAAVLAPYIADGSITANIVFMDMIVPDSDAKKQNIKKIMTNSDVVFMDETSAFPQEWEQPFVREFGSYGIPLFLLGDDFQMSKITHTMSDGRRFVWEYQNVNLIYGSERTLPIRKIWRSSQYQFFNIQRYLRRMSDEDILHGIKVNLRYKMDDDGYMIGGKYVKTEKEVLSDFKAFLREHPDATSDDVMLIVLTSKEKQEVLLDLKNDSTIQGDHSDKIGVLEYDYSGAVNAIDDDTALEALRSNTISGRSVNHVFFMSDLKSKRFNGDLIFDFRKQAAKKNYIRALLTGTSRQVRSLTMVGDPGYSKQAEPNEDIAGYGEQMEDLYSENWKLIHKYNIDANKEGRLYKILGENTRADRYSSEEVFPLTEDAKEDVEEVTEEFRMSIKEKPDASIKDDNRVTTRVWDILQLPKNEENIHLYHNRFIRAVVDSIMSPDDEMAEEALNKAFDEYRPHYEAQYKKPIEDKDAFIAAAKNSFYMNSELYRLFEDELTVKMPSIKIFTDKDGKEPVYGHPFAVEIIGYTLRDNEDGTKTKVPIVNIHHINLVKKDQRGVSKYTKHLMAAYAIMMVKKGAIVNGLVVHNMGIDISKRNTFYYSVYNVNNDPDIQQMLSKTYVEVFKSMELPNGESPKIFARETDLAVNEREVSEESVNRYLKSMNLPPVEYGIIVHIKGDNQAYYFDYVSSQNGEFHAVLINRNNKEKKLMNLMEFSNTFYEKNVIGRKTKWVARSGRMFVDEDRLQWSTVHVFMNTDEGTLPYPKIGRFYDINTNKLLLARQLMIEAIGEGFIATRKIYSKGELSLLQIEQTKKEEFKETKYKIKRNEYVVVHEIDDAIIENILASSKNLCDLLQEYSKQDSSKEAKKLSKKELVAEFKKNGLHIVSIESDVEYDYGNVFGQMQKLHEAPAEVQEKVALFYDAVPTTNNDNQFNENQEELLDEIFEKAFEGDVIMQDPEEEYNDEVREEIKANNILLNKHRMRMRWRMLHPSVSMDDFMEWDINQDVINISKEPGNLIMTEMTKKGGVMAHKRIGISELESNLTRNGVSLQKDGDGNLVVFGKHSGSRIVPGFFIIASRGGKEIQIPVYGRQVTMKDLESYIEEVNALENEVQKVAEKLNAETNKEVRKQIAADFYARHFDNLGAIQFILNNTKSISSLIEKNNYNLFSMYLYLSSYKGKTHVNVRGVYLQQRYENLKLFLKAFKQNLAELQKKVRPFYVSPYAGFNKFNISDLETDVRDISQPNLLFRETSWEKGRQDYNETEDDFSDVDGEFQKVSDMVLKERDPQWVSEDKIRNEWNRLVGEDSDSKLFLKEGLLDPISKRNIGLRSLGTIHDHIVRLGSMDDQYSLIALRHESMHHIMFYLLKPEVTESLLEEARAEMRSKGMDVTFDEDVYDYIADRFAYKEYARKEAKTLLEKFVQWLRRIITNYMGFRGNLESLMNAADNGVFRNMSSSNFNTGLSSDMVVEDRYSLIRNRKYVYNLFGNNDDYIQGLKLRLSDEIINNTVYGKSLSESFTSTEEAITFLWNEYRKYYNGIVAADKTYEYSYKEDGEWKTKKVKISKMTNNDFRRALKYKDGHLENKKVISGYVYYHLGKYTKRVNRDTRETERMPSVVYGVLVKEIFPFVDINEALSGRMRQGSGTIIMDRNNDEVDVRTLRSPWMSMVMSTVVMYHSVSGIKYRMRSDSMRYGNDVFASIKELDMLLYSATQKMKEKYGDTNDYRLWIDEIYKLYLTMKDRKKDLLYSFLLKFGDTYRYKDTLGGLRTKEDKEKGKAFSIVEGSDDAHTKTIINVGYLSLIHNDDLLKNKDLAAYVRIIEKKREHWNTMMKGIFRAYASTTNRIYVYAVYNENGTVTFEKRTGLDETIIKDTLHNNVLMKVLRMDGVITKSIRNKFDKESEKYKYNVTLDGIYSKDGKVIYDKNKKKDINLKEMRDILFMLGYNGVNIDVLKSLHPTYAHEYTLNRNTDKEKAGWEEMSKYVHKIMLTVKASVIMSERLVEANDRLSKYWAEEKKVYIANGNKKLTNEQKNNLPWEKTPLKAYNAEELNILKEWSKIYPGGDGYVNYDFLVSKEFVENPSRLWKKISNYTLPNPTDFWQLSKDYLVPAMISFQMNHATRMVLNADGDYLFPQVLSSSMDDMMPQGMDVSGRMSERIRNEIKEYYQQQGIINTPLASLVNGKIVYNNPILNLSLGFDSFGILSYVMSVVRNVDYAHMSHRDFFKLLFEGYFNSIVSQRTSIQKFGGSLDTLADKKRSPVIEAFLTKNGMADSKLRLFELDREAYGFIKSVKINEMVLTKYFFPDYIRYYQRLREISKKNYKKVKDMTPDEAAAEKGVVLNRDYIIRDGKVMPGHGVTQKDNPYVNIDLSKYEELSTEEKMKIIRIAFAEQFEEFNKEYKNSGFEMFELGKMNAEKDKADGKLRTMDWTGELVKVIRDDKGMVTDVKIHPIMEGVFWSFHIINESIIPLVRGTVYNYDGFIDYVKRASSFVAPGEKYITGIPEISSIGEQFRFMTVKDIELEHPLFYGDTKKRIKALDGYSILNALTMYRMQQDGGSWFGNIYTGSLKNVNFHFNATTNHGQTLKFAQFYPSKEVYENDGFTRDMQRMMIGPTVGNLRVIVMDDYIKFDNNVDTFFEKLDKDYYGTLRDINKFLDSELGKEYKSSIIDFVTMDSGFKTGQEVVISLKSKKNKNVNATSIDDFDIPIELNDEKNVGYISSKTMKLQLVTTQDVVNPRKKVPSQIMYTVGVLPHNVKYADAINGWLSKYMSTKLKEIEELNTFEKRSAYLRRLLGDNVHISDINARVVRIANNGKIHPDVLRLRHIRNLVSEFDDIMNPKMPGQNYIQAPGMFILYIDKNNKPYFFKDAVKISEEEGKVVGDELKGFTKRMMNPRGYRDKEGKMVEDPAMIKDIVENPNNYEYMPEEIVIHFPYVKQFGLIYDNEKGNPTRQYMSMVDALTIAGEFYSYGESKAAIDAYIDKVVEKENGLWNIYRKMSSSQRSSLNREVYNKEEFGKLSSDEKKAMTDRIKLYYHNLNKVLDAFSVRIPTTGSGSGSFARIVGFIYDNSNTAYVSPFKNIIDGSDYDIDSLQIYFRTISKNDFEIIGDKPWQNVSINDQLSHTIFTSIERFYKDPRNADTILDKLSLESFRERASQQEQKMKFYSSNPGTWVKMNRIANDGTLLVGYYANLQNFMSRIFTLYDFYKELGDGAIGKTDKQKQIFGDVTIFDTNETDPIKRDAEVYRRMKYAMRLVTKFVNASTDNIKEGGLLGMLNVDEITTPVVQGMILSGKTEEEIFDLLLNDEKFRTLVTKIRQENHANAYSTKKIYDAIMPEKVVTKEMINGKEVETTTYWGYDIQRYAYLGEQLRRIGDIIGIPNKLKSDPYIIHRMYHQAVNTIGEDLDTFVKIRSKIMGNDILGLTISVDNQMKNLKNKNHKYYSQKKIDHEKNIRKSFNIPAFLIKQPQAVKYLEMILSMRSFMRNTFTQDSKSYDEVLNKINDILHVPDLDYEDVYDAYHKAIGDYIIGNFIGNKYHKGNKEDNSVFLMYTDPTTGKTVHTDDFYTKFSLDNNASAVRFAILFPEYVKMLKEESPFGNNGFIANLRVKPAPYYPDLNIVVLNDSNHYNDTTNTTYLMKEFEELPKTVRRSFEAYNILIYGFSTRNGSMSEVMPLTNEIEYSQYYIRTEGSQEYLKRDSSSIALDIIARNAHILRGRKGIEEGEVITDIAAANVAGDRRKKPVAGIRMMIDDNIRGKDNLTDDDILEAFDRTNYQDIVGMSKSELKKNTEMIIIDSPYPDFINTYRKYVSITQLPVFHRVSAEELMELKKTGKVVAEGFNLPYISETDEKRDDYYYRVRGYYHLGDVVVLPDGSMAEILGREGYGIELKYLGPVQKIVPQTEADLQKADEKSRIVRHDAVKGERVLQYIHDRLKKIFPNIRVEFIDTYSKNNFYPDAIGYVKEGVVYINRDRVQSDTPFHEYGHIIVSIIEQVAPELYSQLKTEALSFYNGDREFKVSIDMSYPDSTFDEKVREIMATMIGWQGAEQAQKYFLSKNSPFLSEFIVKIWNTIKQILQAIAKVFSNRVSNAYGMTDGFLTQDMTLKDIAAKIVKYADEGKVISYISTEEYSLLKHNPEKSAKIEIRTLEDFYRSTINLSEFEMKSQDIIIGNYLKRAAAGLFYDGQYHISQYLTGKEFVFDDLDFEKVHNKFLLAEAVELYKKRANIIRDGLIKILKPSGKKTKGQEGYSGVVNDTLLKELFGEDNKGNPLITETQIEILKRKIEYSPDTKIYNYSDLALIPELKHLYSKELDNFGMFAPIIMVHYTGDKIGISVFDLSRNEKNDRAMDYKDSNILRDYVGDYKSRSLGIAFRNSSKDIRMFMVGLLTSHLLQKDPKIHIHGQALLDYGPDGFNVLWVDPTDVRKTIGAMSKVPEFMMKITSPVIKDIFKKPVRTPHPDLMKVLRTFYETRKGKGFGDKDTPYEFFGMKQIIEGDTSLSVNEKRRILSYRIVKLQDKGTDPRNYSEADLYEIKLISRILKDLDRINIVDMQENPMKDLGHIESFFYDQNSIGNDYFQEIRRVILNSSRKISANVMKIKNEMYREGGLFDLVREVYGRKHALNKEYIKDITAEMFDDLFVKIKIPSNNGIVDAEISAIYWTNDVNDPLIHNETERMMARQAKEKGIDDKLLKAGREIMEIITKYYAEMVLSEVYSNPNLYAWVNDKFYDIKDAEKDLFENSAYFRGFIPVMNKSISQYFSEGDILKAINAIWKQTTDTEILFDDITNPKSKETGDYKKLRDMFFYQIAYNVHGEIKTDYGHVARLNNLGLGYSYDKNGKETLFLHNEKKNKDFSKDIEKILTYFIMSSERKREYEDYVLPMVNGLFMYLTDKYGTGTNVEIKNLIRHTQIFMQQAIYGQRQKVSGKVGGVDVDSVLMMAQSVASPLVMVGNINVPMISMVSNAMYSFIEGISSSLVKGDTGTPSAAEYLEASIKFFSDYAKVTQLAIHYGVIQMSEYDLMMHRSRQKTKKYLFSNYMVNYMNWSADYYGRAVAMIAQMLHDGTYDAHSFNKEKGIIEYDEKKDKSFSDMDKNPEKKAFYNFLKQRIAEQGVFDQDINKPLVARYDLDSVGKFKFLSDKYIVGAYGNMEKSILANFLLGRMALLFHNYLVSRFTNAFSTTQWSTEGGQYKMVKDADGNWMPQWERLFIEGYMITILRYLGTLMTTGKTQKWETLSLNEKRNIMKAIVTLSMFGVFMILYSLTVSKDDDDDKPIPNWRLVRNFKYATSSLLVIPQLIELGNSPFASINIITGFYLDAYGAITFSSYPGKTAFKTIKEPIEYMTENEEE